MNKNDEKNKIVKKKNDFSGDFCCCVGQTFYFSEWKRWWEWVSIHQCVKFHSTEHNALEIEQWNQCIDFIPRITIYCRNHAMHWYHPLTPEFHIYLLRRMLCNAHVIHPYMGKQFKRSNSSKHFGVVTSKHLRWETPKCSAIRGCTVNGAWCTSPGLFQIEISMFKRYITWIWAVQCIQVKRLTLIKLENAHIPKRQHCCHTHCSKHEKRGRKCIFLVFYR